MIVIGARPQIIKTAPLIHAALKESRIKLQVVHTGQHYDYELSKIFFDELELPDPVVNLGVGSGTHSWQTGRMLIKLGEVMLKLKPDVLIVPGDTNSTLAGALAGAKLQIPVAHIEAGARSYDMRMPEEINRRLTDHCSSLLFTVTENCKNNLLNEGLLERDICMAGDTMLDSIIERIPKFSKNDVLEQLDLKKRSYFVLTTHRPENVDNIENLKGIVNAVIRLKKNKIVFPVHPRTENKLRKSGLLTKLKRTQNIICTEPLSYYSMLKLVKEASLVLTDSGGIQKEAFLLDTPCVTLRDNTEWIETVKLNMNILAGANTDRIVQACNQLLNNKPFNRKLSSSSNLFGDGKAAIKIINAILDAWLPRMNSRGAILEK